MPEFMRNARDMFAIVGFAYVASILISRFTYLYL
jgi:hypothetical protein